MSLEIIGLHYNGKLLLGLLSVDQHTHGESYHSPIKKYPAGGRMTDSESEESSDAVC